MQTRLLIVDGVATNRVALKVALSAACYAIEVVSTAKQALQALHRDAFRLVLVGDTLADESAVSFCQMISREFVELAPPVLAFSDEAQKRADLLAAGAEDVLRSSDSTRHLVAAIRSILRARATVEEWKLRDTTNRSLGFAEASPVFSRPVPVTFFSAHAKGKDADWVLNTGFVVQKQPLAHGMRNLTGAQANSVAVIELQSEEDRQALELVSDLRANQETRHMPILALIPENQPGLAAKALDRGASEAFLAPVDGREMSLRLTRLHARAQLHGHLRASIRDNAEAALRDPLTGLFNRRYALPYLSHVAKTSLSSGRPFAVMLADLDHFKHVNDTYGHPAGDAVLQACSDLLVQNVRAVDMVSRIGGEEFLIVLPSTNRADARLAATRLCQKVADTGFKVPGRSEPLDVTVSIGLALSTSSQTQNGDHPDGETYVNDMLDRADKALYRAKQQGRNRYILSQTAA